MPDNVRLLEELVNEAVDRLRDLGRERARLTEEIDGMRERLDALKHEASHSGRGSEAERAWRAQRAQALTVVREALAESHGDC